MTRLAPSVRNRSAVASPIPEAAPVISATLPSRRPPIRILLDARYGEINHGEHGDHREKNYLSSLLINFSLCDLRALRGCPENRVRSSVERLDRDIPELDRVVVAREAEVAGCPFLAGVGAVG